MTAARQARHGRLATTSTTGPCLWKGIGGEERAQEVNRALAPHVDVMIGNEEDFTASLGFEVEGVDENLTDLDTGAFRAMIETRGRGVPELPGHRHDAARRALGDASTTGARSPGRARRASPRPRTGPDLEILDRVGGGDSFASGLAYGLMELGSLQEAVEYGAAHGALAMTTPGDTTMVTLAEVAKLAGGGSARVER